MLSAPGNQGIRAPYIPFRDYIGYLIPSFPTKNQSGYSRGSVLLPIGFLMAPI